jgi:hypothetical protein
MTRTVRLKRQLPVARVVHGIVWLCECRRLRTGRGGSRRPDRKARPSVLAGGCDVEADVRVARQERDRNAAGTLTTKGRVAVRAQRGGDRELGQSVARLVTAAGSAGGLRRDGSGTAWIVGRRRLDIGRPPLSLGERDSCPVKRLAEGKDRAHGELCLHRESEMTGITAEQWLQWMGWATWPSRSSLEAARRSMCRKASPTKGTCSTQDGARSAPGRFPRSFTLNWSPAATRRLRTNRCGGTDAALGWIVLQFHHSHAASTPPADG